VVLALGGISASRRVFGESRAKSSQGWWHEIVGPGKPLDTTRLAVLGMDYIGSSEASTGPDGKTPFPSVSSYDQADAALHLLEEPPPRRKLRFRDLSGTGVSLGSFRYH